jgi:hypothetical protein
MDAVKRLYGSFLARVIAAMILTSAGVILTDIYVQVSLGLAMLGMGLIVAGLAIIPGFGAGRATRS